MKDVRSRLIDATFQEVFSKGYAGASLSNILNRAEVKKGAMYHYFPSKKEMVISMIEEKIEKRIENKWIVLLKTDENIVDALIKILGDINSWDLKDGCPLGNLLQESLDYDEDFAQILTNILNNWKILFKNILEEAKQKKQIKAEISSEQIATFLIAAIEGALLLTKKYETSNEFQSCMNQLSFYLNSLRNKEVNENI